MTGTPEDWLHEMGMSRCESNELVTSFVPTVRTGYLLGVAGQKRTVMSLG